MISPWNDVIKNKLLLNLPGGGRLEGHKAEPFGAAVGRRVSDNLHLGERAELAEVLRHRGLVCGETEAANEDSTVIVGHFWCCVCYACSKTAKTFIS